MERLVARPQRLARVTLVVLALLAAFVAGLHYRQRSILGRVTAELDLVRRARIELDEKIIAAAVPRSREPRSGRQDDLESVRQASDTFDQVLSELEPAERGRLEAFRERALHFQAHLADWTRKASRQPEEEEVALRAALDDLEREAQRDDAEVAGDLQRLAEQLDRQFAWALGGAGSLVVSVGAVVWVAGIAGSESERARLEAERRWQFALEGAGDGVWDWDLQTGRVFFSPRVKAMVGYAGNEIGETVADWETLVHPDDAEQAREAMTNHLAGFSPTYAVEHRLRCKDGSYKWVLARGRVVHRAPDGRALRFIGVNTDIGARKAQETELRRLNRLHAALLRVNHATVRARSRESMFDEVCQLLVESGGYELVWIGLREPASNAVVPVAQHGDTQGFVAGLGVVADEKPRGMGPTGSAIRKGVPQVFGDLFFDERASPWREGLERSGWRAAASFPLERTGRIVGALTVYARETDFFAAPEVALLEEAARDVSVALDNLERETQRQSAERRLTERGHELETANLALRESERRYRALFEANPHPMWVFDDDTLGFLAVNDAAVRHYGYAREEFLGMTLEDVRPPEDVPLLRDSLASSRRVAERASSWRHRRKNGEIVFVEVIAHRLDWGGRPGTIVLINDVTGRKHAEEQIREQAALLDAANDAIYVRSLDRTISYWNRGAERLYGWTREQAIGRRTTALFSTDPEVAAAVQAVLLETGSWAGERPQTTSTGRTVVCFCRLTLLRDAGGNPGAVLAINTDITEKKQLESQLLRAQRLDSLGALASGIAHDLNNILTPVLMAGPILRRGVQDPAQLEMIDTIEASARRGAEIVKQVLTFARGTPGTRVTLQVRHILADMEQIIRETFPKNIQLRVAAPHAPWLVSGDPTQVHQVLMNLCVNARDAMPDGGVLALDVENFPIDPAFAAQNAGAHAGPHLRIAVADTGTGIAHEDLERIFDPFFTTKEVGKGTGLGLSTVSGIVRGHGGFVRVQSEPGEGSLFEVFLPATPGEEPGEASPDEPMSPRAAGETILVVDDEAPVRALMQSALEQQGYRVRLAADGLQGMAALAGDAAGIRVVISDMMMPGMDGATFVRLVRRQHPRLPLIGMSGLDQAAVSECPELPLTTFLKKPFDVSRLLAAVEEALARAENRLSA